MARLPESGSRSPRGACPSSDCYVGAAAVEPEELLRFSALHRLLRGSAWCRRWPAGRDLERPSRGGVSVAELEASRVGWIRTVQAIHFGREIEAARQHRDPPSASCLVRLSPFLDSDGILRMEERLDNALLSYEKKHPVILPSDSHLTLLVTRSYHLRSLHGGVQLTLNLSRQKYWILRGRSTVKRLISRCVTCAHWRAGIPRQLMSKLPRARVTPSRALLHTGVDYAGPIRLRTSKGRGHKAYKAFIAVFVCLSTRAIHLEAVSDYTAEAFLVTIRRFVFRINTTYHSNYSIALL